MPEASLHQSARTSRAIMTCPDPTSERAPKSEATIPLDPNALFGMIELIAQKCFEPVFLKVQRGYSEYRADEVIVKPGMVAVTLECDGDKDNPRTTYIGNVRTMGHYITIGALAHIGDGVTIGNRVIVGEGADVEDFVRLNHGSQVGTECSIEVGAKLLESSVVGDNSVVGYGAEIPYDSIVPTDSKVSPNTIFSLADNPTT